MTTYACRDCGHVYGASVPNPARIALHRAVSHSGGTPIANKPADLARYTVTATHGGYVKAVHHAIRAASEADAIETARMYHPPRANYSFQAEKE